MKYKFVVVALSTLSMSLSVSAATWVFVSKNVNGTMTFIDTTSIQRRGDLVTFWTKENFGSRLPQGVLSAKVQRSINCNREEVIVRYAIFFDEPDANGRVRDEFSDSSWTWVPVSPEDKTSALMQFVCRK